MGHLGFGHPKEANVFCFLSSLPLLPPSHHDSVWLLPVISLISVISKPNTVSPVWICLLKVVGAKKKTIVGLLVFNTLWGNLNLSPNFLTLKEPRNRLQGINSSSLCSPAGQYDNSIPTRFLAPVDCLKFQH